MTNTYTMLHGDCMSLMPTMPEASYDAVITDPPYASGGMVTSARQEDPRIKYQNAKTQAYYPSFENDNRDQRTHLMWSVRWMEQALRLTRPGGWLMVFSDWRQVPLTSDALQIAGWQWRGIAVWDKANFPDLLLGYSVHRLNTYCMQHGGKGINQSNKRVALQVYFTPL